MFTTPKRELFQLMFRWGPRQETQAECEAHTLRFLKGLTKLDPIFQKWRLDAWSRDKPIAATPAGIHDLLERTAFRDDISQQRRLENGYSIDLTTFGPDDEHCSLHLDIGGYSSPLTENRCEVTPPYVGASAKRIWKTAAIQELCRWIIRSWAPDSGEVFSWESLQLIDDFNTYAPRPGWIMYTTRPEAAQLKLPKPSSIDTIALLFQQRAACRAAPPRVQGARPAYSRRDDALAQAETREATIAGLNSRCCILVWMGRCPALRARHASRYDRRKHTIHEGMLPWLPTISFWT
jgi:hypothetical protein